MPGERLNLGPLDRRLISWALRLPVRSVTRSGLIVVMLSGELVLLLSVLFKSVVMLFWSDELFGVLFSEVLALLRFFRLSSCVRSLLLCRLLAVLYAKYLWERIWMLLKRGMGNGIWGMGNGKLKMGNGKLKMGN